MKEPIRNLIVYADGRVQEVPFRLAGNTYIQTEKVRHGVFFHRHFDGGYASDGFEDGAYTMVYVERGSPMQNPPDNGPPTVNGTPVLVDAPMADSKAAPDLHRGCVKAGGHQISYGSDVCRECGLSGRAVKYLEREALREDEDRRSAGGLRDQLVHLRDENAAIKVENCNLRREVERLTRRTSK